MMRLDSWNKLSRFRGIFQRKTEGLSHLANLLSLMETKTEAGRGQKHTCHPWNFDCCRTKRHLSSADSFFLSPKVGTTRSLYLRTTKKQKTSEPKKWMCWLAKFRWDVATDLFWKQWVQRSLGLYGRPASSICSYWCCPWQRLPWTVSWIGSVVCLCRDGRWETQRVSQLSVFDFKSGMIELFLLSFYLTRVSQVSCLKCSSGHAGSIAICDREVVDESLLVFHIGR